MTTEVVDPKFCQRCRRPITKKDVYPGVGKNKIGLCPDCRKWADKQHQKCAELWQKFNRR